MVLKVYINGEIIPDDYKWYYDFFEMSSTAPMDVKQVLNTAKLGDTISVYINSPGGEISAGSEIYTMLRDAAQTFDVKIYVTGEACSAASIIACAAYCEMAPTALMMVHCVSCEAFGNHNDMEKTSEMLQTADKALCTAYMNKAGMSEEEALAMMNAETWLTAEQAKEKGLIDGIMFEDEEGTEPMVAGLFRLPSDEQLAKARTLMEAQKAQEEAKAKKQLDLVTLRFNYLKNKTLA